MHACVHVCGGRWSNCTVTLPSIVQIHLIEYLQRLDAIKKQENEYACMERSQMDVAWKKRTCWTSLSMYMRVDKSYNRIRLQERTEQRLYTCASPQRGWGMPTYHCHPISHNCLFKTKAKTNTWSSDSQTALNLSMRMHYFALQSSLWSNLVSWFERSMQYTGLAVSCGHESTKHIPANKILCLHL
jgi:hypothetical protein